MEWRKVSQPYGAAGMACSLSCGKLGPAGLCPACAAVPAADPERDVPTATGACEAAGAALSGLVCVLDIGL